MKVGGNYYFYHNDHLGTPQKLTGVNGAVVWSAKYESFGKTTVEVEAVESNLRFPGQYFDEETGLHYNYHRYYDPRTGRYLTPDPIGLEGGINLFAYVNNNPINETDPLGLCEVIGEYIQKPTAEVTDWSLVGIMWARLNPGGKIGIGLAGLTFSVTGTVSGSIECTKTCIDECDEEKVDKWIISGSASVTAPVTIGVGITINIANFYNIPKGAHDVYEGYKHYSRFQKALIKAGESQDIPDALCAASQPSGN